jgi:uncharacterized iron-regulated protein
MALGMEMFYRQHQPVLDQYIFGSGTLSSLKQDTNWDKTWYVFARDRVYFLW